MRRWLQFIPFILPLFAASAFAHAPVPKGFSPQSLFDGNGNLLVRGTQRMDYDAENRLLFVLTATTANTFGYDAGGARLWQQGARNLRVWLTPNRMKPRHQHNSARKKPFFSAARKNPCAGRASGGNDGSSTKRHEP